MNALAITLCVACQFLLVTGQLFLKHAMNNTGGETAQRATVIRNFAAGVACLTGWFLLWVGLLQQWDLSRIFPFEGINPALLVIGAWVFLKEKLPSHAWVGIALICAGVALVTGS